MTALEVLKDVAERLERLRIPYVIGGSLASSTWGQMRQTNDVDIAIALRQGDLSSFESGFSDSYLISEPELLGAFGSTELFRPVQLLHIEEVFKVDLFLLADGPYERSELERAISVEVFPGTFIQFSSPENVILAKLRWFNLGNRVSDRQWNDIVQVLDVQGERLDWPYLERWASNFNVSDLLIQARNQVLGRN